MKKILVILILLIASPAFAEFIPIQQEVTFPSASSGAEIANSLLSNVETPDWTETGGSAEVYIPFVEKKIQEQLNLVTFSSYMNVGDMPITRAILGTAKFNMRFWPEVANTLAENMTSGTFIDAKNKANALLDGPIPRAEAVAAHAQGILHDIIYPVAIGILSVVFVVQIIATLLSSRTQVTHFATHFFRFMFFLIAIYFFRVWVVLLLDIFNFAGYLISPWGAQADMQQSMVEAAQMGGAFKWLDLASIVTAIMRWAAYMAIKVLFISRDVMFAVTLVTGPLCLAMGYLSLYTQNDFVKGFLSGWLQNFFKFQFWGVFASVALIGLSIVDFLSKSGSVEPLVVFITGIAFVHAAFNIPKLADNMSSVVISSVLMATLSMAATRGAGTATAGAAETARSNARRLLRR